MLKYALNLFPSIDFNASEKFVCLCRRTVNPTYTIFNKVHAISDMSYIFKFQDIRRIFTRVRARTDRQTDRRTDRQTECINTFQRCWKVLKRLHRFSIYCLFELF